MAPFDVAQICKNGHLINDSVKRPPEYNKNFCDKCGAQTITKCPNCSFEIQGRDHRVSIVGGGSTYYPIRAFCPNCGRPYPWTKAKIQAAQELTQELENISDNEKEILTQSIDEMIKDSPKATLAAAKSKKILSKMSKQVVDAFKEILVDIMSETAKKLLWP